MDSPSFVYMPTAGVEEKRSVIVDDFMEISGDNSRLMTASSEGDCTCSRRNIRTRSALCLPVCVSLTCCVVAVTMCIIVVVLTNSSMKEWEERMEARIEQKIMSIVEEKCDFDVTEIRKVLSGKGEKLMDGTLFRSRRADKPKKGAKGAPAIEPKSDIKPKKLKYVHLNGRNSTVIYDGFHGRKFLWDYKSTGKIMNMELVRDADTNAIVAVRIEKAGPYMMYSQVAVNGQSRVDVRLPYDCAHVTVLTRKNEDTVLLKSLTTQRYMGEPLPSGNYYEDLKPVDTKLQMGVFYLQPGDLLSVKICDDCDHFNYVMQPDHSYFGVIQMKL